MASCYVDITAVIFSSNPRSQLPRANYPECREVTAASADLCTEASIEKIPVEKYPKRTQPLGRQVRLHRVSYCLHVNL